MKKAISLVIAIMLVISIFSCSVVAFAADEDEEVAQTTVDNDAFLALNTAETRVHKMESTFQLDTEWLTDVSKVKSVFPDIVYELDHSQTVKYTDSSSTVTSIVFNQGTLTVKFSGSTEGVTLTNGSYDATAANPLVGTWSNSENGSSIVFTSDGNATASLKTSADATAVTASLTGVSLGAETKYAVTSSSNIIRVQYLTSSKDSKDDSDWVSKDLGSDINVSSSGWWLFRYIVCSVGSKTEIIGKTNPIEIYFYDGSAPEVTGLSSSMKTTQEDGIKVGNTYSIRTSLSITDKSSYTVSYVLYRKESGNWKQIYDSTSSEVAEGYEKYVSTSGVITFQAEDVLADNEPIYKIVYSVVDTMGYTSNTTTEGDPIEMTIFAVAADATPVDTNKIISYVLYGVAGLCLVGIIVVLCIKPKEEKAPKTDTSAK